MMSVKLHLPIVLSFFIFNLLLIPEKIISQDNPSNNLTDRIIIRFKPNVSDLEKTKIYQGVKGKAKEKIDRLNAQVLELPKGAAKGVLEKLKKNINIVYAEEDYLAYTLESTNDPYLINQWGLTKIKVAATSESAWNYSKGNSSILVSVVDTGVDQNHQDLTGKIAKNKNCTSSYTVDDRYGHGTHVGGIVAATTNNSTGVAGTGYNIRLINAKGLGDNGSGYYSWIANCIIWSVDNGASAINLSLGGSSYSKTLEDAVNYAWGKGVVLLAAAGNSGTSSASYPAYYDNAVAVAATDSNDQKASWSNYGNWVDVASPGVSIYSTVPNHTNSLKVYNYAYLSGTSMATPFVAGLVGLIKSASLLDNQSIVNLIYDNADKISNTGNYWQHGRINALNSLKNIIPVNTTATPTLTLTPTPTSAQPQPTPTVTPTPPTGTSPTPTPTPTPTITPTKTPTITPTPTIVSSPTPTPTPWWCYYIPSFCD